MVRYRKKKVVLKPESETKFVRIDPKTVIQVSIDISDEDAIMNYHKKHDQN